MKAIQAHLVVLAGGSGSRLWPRSSDDRPKQLLSFGGGGACTLLEQTLHRFTGMIPASQQLIVTTRALADAVATNAPGRRVLAEPQGRNTAPAIYWAAREVAAENPESIMLIMPADHFIAQPDAFHTTLSAAIERARHHDELVTLGIQPTRPETGYGYLKLGVALDAHGACTVDAFVEKPNALDAERFLSSGRYLWNGGMFVWRAETILEAFDQHMPEMRTAWSAAQDVVELAYPRATATSIDFGIMEKATNVVTFPLSCGWDDLGNWTSLETLADHLGLHQQNNVSYDSQLIAHESMGNIVCMEGGRVALLGVHNLIIVQGNGVVMVADKSRAQDVRILARLNASHGSPLV